MRAIGLMRPASIAMALLIADNHTDTNTASKWNDTTKAYLRLVRREAIKRVIERWRDRDVDDDLRVTGRVFRVAHYAQA